MASVNITEKEYQALFGVVIDLQERGETEDAAALDKLAQKMNTALSRGRMPIVPGYMRESEEAKAAFQAESPLELSKRICQKAATAD